MADMPGREPFAIAIKCPKCGQAGSAIWEETDAFSRQHGPQRTLKLLSSGFFQRPAPMPALDPQIVCDRCDTVLPD